MGGVVADAYITCSNWVLMFGHNDCVVLFFPQI